LPAALSFSSDRGRGRTGGAATSYDASTLNCPRLLLAAGALAACASRPAVRVERRDEEPIRARVAVVYPYAFRWDEPPIRSYQKSMDAVLLLASKGRLLLFGPDEFEILRPGDPDPRVATDIAHVLAVRGLDTRGFLVFRGWAERRVAQGMSVVEGKGKTRAASSEEVTYVAHLEVIDGGTGRTLLELAAQAPALPAEERPDYDSMPELTALNRQLVEEAWKEIEPRLTAPPLMTAPLELRWLPAAALDYGPRGQPTTRQRMLSMDPLQASAERISIYQYFAPQTEPRLLHEELRLPGGLYVGGVQGDLQRLLQKGDVITFVNGEVILGPHVLQRALNLSKDQLLQLKVTRGSARLELNVSLH